jgi:hypothetical protein
MNIKIAAMSSLLLLTAGCAQNQNGSPSVNLSMASLLNSTGLTKPLESVQQGSSAQQNQIITTQNQDTAPLNGTPIATTKLLDLFSNSPNAVVSVAIKHLNRNDCWLGDVTIWYSASKSEQINNVEICKPTDPASAAQVAYNYDIFLHQVNTLGKDSGSKRTTGPVPPATVEPMNIATSYSVKEFMGAFITHTNWEPTVGKITLWVVSGS